MSVKNTWTLLLEREIQNASEYHQRTQFIFFSLSKEDIVAADDDVSFAARQRAIITTTFTTAFSKIVKVAKAFWWEAKRCVGVSYL